MKVKDILKHIDYVNSELPVILKERGVKARKAFSWDFAGYHYDEADRTVTSIYVLKDSIIINYK